MILAGDMGGTKTLLALCDDAGRIQREAMFRCAEFNSLEAVIDAFLTDGDAITASCFGVAGPVVAGTAKITNLPWTITEANLSQRLGGARVRLLNDLQATALGTLVVPADKFAVLQAGEATPGATIAVIAPGTGLGEALLVSDGTTYRALPSEGGHADWAPGTEEEIELWRFLRARYGNHVSNERVLCGNGIGDLYDFVRSRSGAEPAALTAELAAGDRNVIISQMAIAGRDPVCVRALEMFTELIAAEASNLVLRGLATGGVMIGGGIPPKILPMLQRPAVIERFNMKGRFEKLTRSVPVRVVLEPRAALLGAAHCASLMRQGA